MTDGKPAAEELGRNDAERLSPCGHWQFSWRRFAVFGVEDDGRMGGDTLPVGYVRRQYHRLSHHWFRVGTSLGRMALGRHEAHSDNRFLRWFHHFLHVYEREYVTDEKRRFHDGGTLHVRQYCHRFRCGGGWSPTGQNLSVVATEKVGEGHWQIPCRHHFPSPSPIVVQLSEKQCFMNWFAKAHLSLSKSLPIAVRNMTFRNAKAHE